MHHSTVLAFSYSVWEIAGVALPPGVGLRHGTQLTSPNTNLFADQACAPVGWNLDDYLVFRLDVAKTLMPPKSRRQKQASKAGRASAMAKKLKTVDDNGGALAGSGRFSELSLISSSPCLQKSSRE